MNFLNGYDNCSIKVGDRVELHPGTDLWARGAKYGEVRRIDPTTHYATVAMDNATVRGMRRFHQSRLKRC
jgi:hypothetical protein